MKTERKPVTTKGNKPLECAVAARVERTVLSDSAHMSMGFAFSRRHWPTQRSPSAETVNTASWTRCGLLLCFWASGLRHPWALQKKQWSRVRRCEAKLPNRERHPHTAAESTDWDSVSFIRMLESFMPSGLRTCIIHPSKFQRSKQIKKNKANKQR